MTNDSKDANKDRTFFVTLKLVFILAIILSVMTVLGSFYYVPLAIIGYAILLKRSKSLAGSWSFGLMWLSLAAYFVFFFTATGFDDGSDAYWLLTKVDEGIAQLLLVLHGSSLIIYLMPLVMTWRDGKIKP